MTRTLRLNDEASWNSLQEVAHSFRKARKVVFVTGAGVSCNAGIPDFRSENGLYNLVKNQHPDAVVKGQELFDCNLFRNQATAEIFYTFMAGLRKATLNAKPTPTHQLIRYLRDKRRLLRCYTQNIDGLEKEAGLRIGYTDPGKLEVVQLHGDIHSLKCPVCYQETEWTDEYERELETGAAPECSNCRELEQVRSLAGKRSRTVGLLRPNIVLYGEEHPYGDIIGSCSAKDIKSNPDMLVIVGTSLKVVGICRLVRDLAKAVQAKGGKILFVNRTPVSASQWENIIDYHIEADSDSWVEDLKNRIPTFFKIQSKISVGATKRLAPGYSKPVTPEKKIKKEEYPIIKAEIEGDLLRCSPQSFGVFAVSPQAVGPIKLGPFDAHYIQNPLISTAGPEFQLHTS